jgi:hypothetical protein
MESSCKISILPFSLSKVSQVNIRTKRERDGKVDGKKKRWMKRSWIELNVWILIFIITVL